MLKAFQCSGCRKIVTSFRETAPACDGCGLGPLFQRLVYSDPLKPAEIRETVAQEEIWTPTQER